MPPTSGAAALECSATVPKLRLWDVRSTWASWLGLRGLAQRRTAGFQLGWSILADEKLEVSPWKLRRVLE